MGSDATPYVEPLLSPDTPGFLSYHGEIPYAKGASLWHMLEAFWDAAGQEAFRVWKTYLKVWISSFECRIRKFNLT